MLEAQQLNTILKHVAQIGPYVLEKKIFEGPAWTHFRARQENRIVRLAVRKLIAEERPRLSNVPNRSNLKHSRVVPLLADGIDILGPKHRRWIAFDWVPGQSLEHSLNKGAIPAELAAYVVSELARFAHEARLDPRWFERIDPGAVLIDLGGRIHLTRMPQRSVPSGSFARASFEFVRRQSTTISGALFCLGGLLFELLTGAPPFLRPEEEDTATAIAYREVTALAGRSDIPPAIASVVDAAIGLSGPTGQLPDFRTMQHALRSTLPKGDLDLVLLAWVRELERSDENETRRKLMKEIIQAPERTDASTGAYLVLSDYLQSQDDLRGELIALQAAAVSAENASDRVRLKQAQSRMIFENREVLLGPLSPYFGQPGPKHEPRIHGGPHYTGRSSAGPLLASWHMGFIRSMRVDLSALNFRSPNEVLGAPLLLLGEVESSKHLREISIGHLQPSDDFDFTSVYRVLPALPPSVRMLFLGDLSGPLASGTPACTHEFTAPLCRALPELTHLALRGARICLSPLRLPQLEELRIHSPGMQLDTLAGIAEGALPRLRYLELASAPGVGRNAFPKEICEHLSAEALPSLRHVALIEREPFAVKKLIDALLDWPLLERLETLSLAGGALSDRAVRALVVNRARFAHLKYLDLRSNPISKDMQRFARDVRFITDGEKPKETNETFEPLEGPPNNP